MQLFYRYDNGVYEDFGDRIRSYCDVGDVFCDIGTSVNIFAHISYIDNYGEEAVKFVVDQYKNWSGPSGGSDSTTPTAAPTPLSTTIAADSLGPILAVGITASVVSLGLM